MALLHRALWLLSLPSLCVASLQTAQDADAFVSYRGEVKVRSDSHLNDAAFYDQVNGTDGRFDHGAEIRKWVIQQGGSIHQDMEIRSMDDSTNSTSYRVFATAEIAKGAPLMVFPKSTLIMSDSQEKPECRRQSTARKLLREIQRGPKSQFAPYIEYLLDSNFNLNYRVPTASWSRASKELLNKLLTSEQRSSEENRHDSEDDSEEEPWGIDIDLPPEDATRDSLFDTFHRDCSVSLSDTKHDAINAFKLLHQRASSERDDIMIPLYDMLQHRRGTSLNTDIEFIESGDGVVTTVVVKSTHTIKEGEEIFGSYHGGDEAYGTPEIFRDYGFVESYPQHFTFHYTDVAFELDVRRPDLLDKENDRSRPELVVRWHKQRPYEEDIGFLKSQLKRLVEIADDFKEQSPSIPLHEWKLIVQFYKTMVTAIDEAIFAYHDESTCVIGTGTCLEYDKLEAQPDKLDYHKPTCDTTPILKFSGYEILDKFQTAYQEATFFRNPETTDTCFDLDGTVQICSSYREHYHTMAVNYPARYLDKVERALFVGGGDSMILHELLKYKTLQKVVGLELDQKVTRYSFKHFGTQPHWDDDRVEWWFGDAAKSLLMLPKEYFASFDLVIVDLSETVMSLTVTDGLDIFGALALLLKPEGIIVKNEAYVQKFAELFDYTVQSLLYDNPVVCSQLMSYGSYENDFLKKEPNFHRIESILMDTRNELQADYEAWHDYKKNTTRSRATCADPNEVKEEPAEQTSSPGVLMVLEAEDTSSVVENPEQLKDVLAKTVQVQGYDVVSSTVRGPVSNDDNKAMIAIVLKEGYVLCRTWPTRKYIAFDIQLWSKTGTQDDLRKSLVASVGSLQPKSSSAYRVVSGGMFGVPSWREDEKNRGPRLRDDCDSTAEAGLEDPFVQDTAVDTNILVKQAMALNDEKNITVAVVCGEETERCKSLDVVSKLDYVRTTIPLWSCPNLANADWNDEGDLKAMRACQRGAIQKLQEATHHWMKVRAIIIDSSAPFAMGQILVKMLTDQHVKSKLLADDVLAISTIVKEEESWRGELMDRFRQDIIVEDPVFRVQSSFTAGSGSKIELDLVSSGDADFISHFHDVASKIEKETKTVADVRNIHGGLMNYQPYFDPEDRFYPRDYNHSSALEQFLSQEPLGFQTLFQLERKPFEKLATEGARVEVDYSLYGQGWVSGILVESEDDGQWDVEFDDGDWAYGIQSRYVRLVDRPTLSHQQVKKATKTALLPFSKVVRLEEHSDLGEGALWVVLWQEGSVAVLWDGRDHIDLNLFTYEEDIVNADEFVDRFLEDISAWEVALRDEQPRGRGRVVNFQKDLRNSTRPLPHWAED